MTKISIGIQARTSSKRFPNKINEIVIDNKTMLQMVMESAFKASQYVNNSQRGLLCEVSLLIPHGDPIKNKVASEINVIEGPEDDVLSRYFMLLNQQQPDFICRVTADCPLIPSFVISKHINLVVLNNYDYVSNVDERCRTAPDGWDCEVMSKKTLIYLNDNVTDKNDREHVTTYLRSKPPPWLFQGAVVGYLDLSNEKISVDTKEDLEKVKEKAFDVKVKLDQANRIFGKGSTHRL